MQIIGTLILLYFKELTNRIRYQWSQTPVVSMTTRLIVQIKQMYKLSRSYIIRALQ